MPQSLGSLQARLLHALRRHGQEAPLESLAALAAGLIPDLGTRTPAGRAPSRAVYSATARALTALKRRGLVVVETVGVKKGRLEWHRSESGTLKPAWRFRNPSTRTYVRVSVETSPSDLLPVVARVGDHE